MKEFTSKGYLVDENDNIIEKELYYKENKEYKSISDGRITLMIKNEELREDLDNIKICLEIYNFETGKSFRKYFKTIQDKERFAQKVKFSKKLKIVKDYMKAWEGKE